MTPRRWPQSWAPLRRRRRALWCCRWSSRWASPHWAPARSCCSLPESRRMSENRRNLHLHHRVSAGCLNYQGTLSEGVLVQFRQNPNWAQFWFAQYPCCLYKNGQMKTAKIKIFKISSLKSSNSHLQHVNKVKRHNYLHKTCLSKQVTPMYKK